MERQADDDVDRVLMREGLSGPAGVIAVRWLFPLDSGHHLTCRELCAQTWECLLAPGFFIRAPWLSLGSRIFANFDRHSEKGLSSRVDLRM